MPRTLFGTDGVRGAVGDLITADLALALARAATRMEGHEHPRGRAGRALDAGGGRAGERQGEIRGEELARDAADPVRAEQTAGQDAAL